MEMIRHHTVVPALNLEILDDVPEQVHKLPVVGVIQKD